MSSKGARVIISDKYITKSLVGQLGTIVKVSPATGPFQAVYTVELDLGSTHLCSEEDLSLDAALIFLQTDDIVRVKNNFIVTSLHGCRGKILSKKMSQLGSEIYEVELFKNQKIYSFLFDELEYISGPTTKMPNTNHLSLNSSGTWGGWGNTTLPQGFANLDDVEKYLTKDEPKKENKCHCGVNVAMGDVDYSFHSAAMPCPVYTEGAAKKK